MMRRKPGRSGPHIPAAVGIPLALLAGVGFVALSPVAVPLLLWKKHVKEKKCQIREGQRRSCPPHRGIYKSKCRRAMTLEILRPKSKTPANPAPQPDCPLLNLPYEIRELIWRACLEGGCIHLSKYHGAH
jgi:hypothetical protein